MLALLGDTYKINMILKEHWTLVISTNLVLINIQCSLKYRLDTVDSFVEHNFPRTKTRLDIGDTDIKHWCCQIGHLI